MPLNDSNFLMWFAAGESPTAPPLPRPFVVEPDVLSPVVWLVPGEVCSFYVNSLSNTALAGPLKLLHEKTGSTLQNLTQVTAVIDFVGNQHTYGNFTVPANLPPGLVRLSMGGYLSQWLWLATAEQAATCTMLVAFNNNGRRLQNIRYSYLPPDFKQQFRIRLAVTSYEPASNKEIYVESDTGHRRHLYSEPEWVTKFITPEYDFWGHRAMASLIEHDNITINGQVYTYQGPYKANSTAGDALSQGEVEMCEEKYSTLNRA